MSSELEAEILSKHWFYRFPLPNGAETTPYGPEQLHNDRLQMMWEAIKLHCHDDLGSMSATDIACHQGWFSYHLASGGFGSVTGVDARPEHVAQADLIRQIYKLTNLHLLNYNIFDPAVCALDKTDLVLMYGLIYHLEDPIGALRIASNLTKRLLLIETQVMNTDMTGTIDWGNHGNQIDVRGAFGLIYEPDAQNLETGVSGLALVPSPSVLVWLLQQFGFKSVIIMDCKPEAHEQLLSRKRVVIAAVR